jgi:hypothetical protein
LPRSARLLSRTVDLLGRDAIETDRIPLLE